MNGAIADEIIEQLGWTLLHFLWQGLVIAIVLAIVLTVLKKASSNSRYVAGCVALLIMIAAPVGTYINLANLHAPEPPIALRGQTPEAAPQPTAAKAEPVQVIKVTTEEKKSLVSEPSINERLNDFLPLLVLAWAIGVLILSFRLAAGWLRVTQLKRAGVQAVDEVWHRMLAELGQRLHIKRTVHLVQSFAVEVPTVIGWLRPIILMPAGCLAGLGPAQVEYILAHELAHVRRQDYLVNLFQCLVETLLFYHPAVWWVSKRIREEREHCCDDVAVSVCGDRLEYARTLAALEQLRGSQNQLVMAAAGAPLLQRIKRLAGQSERNPSHPVWPLAAIVILAVVATLGIGIRSSRAVADETQGSILRTNRQATAIVKSDSQAQAGAFAGQGSSTNQTAPQVHIEAKFFELDEMDFPKSIFNLPGASNAVSTSIKLTIPKHSSQVLANVTNSIVQSFAGQLSEPEYQKALKAFKAARSAEAPATPSVTTLVGRQARLFVGEEIPVLTNNSPTATATLMPFGVMFDVTPTLVANGTRLQLATMATVAKRIDARTKVTPPVQVAQLGMDATLEDGQTLVMGGFMPEVVTKTKDKVPVLGYIPLAGRLFQSENVSKRKKYLIVFITPTLINPDGSRLHSDQARTNQKQETQKNSYPTIPGIKTDIPLNPPNVPQHEFYLRQYGKTNKEGLQEPIKKQGIRNGRKEIQSKLDRIRIDSVEYDGLVLGEVIINLSEISKARDPDKQGINFFINREAPAAARVPGAVNPATGLPNNAAKENGDPAAVVLKMPPAMTNVSLTAVLDCIATNNSLQYAIEDYAVVFNFKSTEPEPLFWKTYKLDQEAFNRKLHLFGPEYTGTNASTLTIFLHNFFKTNGIDFSPTNPMNAGKSLGFNSRGLLAVHTTREELDLIEKLLPKISTESPQSQTNAHRIMPAEQKETLFSKTYRLSKTEKEYISRQLKDGALNQNGTPTAGAGENSNPTVATNSNRELQLSIRKFFEAAGADFSPSISSKVGKSIFYNETKGLLLVRSTRVDLDLIERALAKIDAQPQIHIKASIAEIDEETSKLLKLEDLMKAADAKTNFNVPELTAQNNSESGGTSKLTNSLAAQFISVLTPELSKEFLGRLKKADGAILFPLPDVTTQNNRQAQLQAVDIRTIVTGLTTVWTNGTPTNIYSTQTLPFGPVVDLIPKLSEDNSTIEMNIIATMTEFLGYDDPASLGDQNRTDVKIPLPKIKLRQLTSSTTLVDGQTIILGGMEATSIVSKTGSKQEKRKNLILLITPTLIHPDGSTYHKVQKL